MNAAWIEDLAKMDLKEGDVVRFDVEDLWMELRVLPKENRNGRAMPYSIPSAEDLANIMIEAPFDLPHYSGGVPCEVRAVSELPFFDIPEIPSDEVEE